MYKLRLSNESIVQISIPGYSYPNFLIQPCGREIMRYFRPRRDNVPIREKTCDERPSYGFGRVT